MKEARSGIQMANIQEVLDAEDSAKWATVPSYPQIEVSNLGQVKVNGVLKTPYRLSSRRPYLTIKLNKQRHLVHRLVAAAFLGGSGLEVNHKNGIANDNRLSNLEYCTHSENVQHAYSTGLNEKVRTASSKAMSIAHHEGRINYPKGTARPNSKFTDSTALEAKKLYAKGFGDKYVARKFGVSRETARQIRHGKTWRHV